MDGASLQRPTLLNAYAVLAEHSTNPADKQQIISKNIYTLHHCILVSCKLSKTPTITEGVTADVTKLHGYGWRLPVQAAWSSVTSPDGRTQKAQQHACRVGTCMLFHGVVVKPTRIVQSIHSPAMCDCRDALTGASAAPAHVDRHSKLQHGAIKH